MRYLLDTHILLWARSMPDRLSADMRAILESQENDLHVSIVTLWECAIKSSIGKLVIPENFYRIVAGDYTLIGVEVTHLEACANLPMHHRDPFDRLLIAQAQISGLTVVTRDRNIMKYDISVAMV